MGIKLGIEISSPLTDDDKELLAGVAAMTFAIANQGVLEQPIEDEPGPCGSLNDEDEMCLSEVGHRGRHKYRPISFTGSLN